MLGHLLGAPALHQRNEAGRSQGSEDAKNGNGHQEFKRREATLWVPPELMAALKLGFSATGRDGHAAILRRALNGAA
ncbi:hypothetical protein GCM10027019_03430 [Melaminivora jejuensis]